MDVNFNESTIQSKVTGKGQCLDDETKKIKGESKDYNNYFFRCGSQARRHLTGH